ncbi:MAG: Lon protease family protein [Candidatus Promineifilaceae bacterium]
MTSVAALDAEALYTECDPAQFDFQTTAELEPLSEVIGQERAMEAIEFGIGIQQDGFNLFALGPNGAGKFTAVRGALGRRAGKEEVPADWVYVYNFEHPHRPRAISLPAGTGLEFQRQMQALVEELAVVMPAVFEGEAYLNQRKAIEAEFQERQEGLLEEVQKEAAGQDIAMLRTPDGLAFAPLRDKEVIKPDDFMRLPEEEREAIEGRIEALQGKLQSVIRRVPQWTREARSRVRALDREVADFALTPLFDELKEKHGAQAEVIAYLDTAKADIIEHSDAFLDSGQDESAGPVGLLMGAAARRGKAAYANRYQVNAVVDNSQQSGAPVIHEQNPTYQNLIGRVEHVAQMGALLTDFSLIRAGALHRANGGYLILDVHKLLSQPFAWDGLKRALRGGEIVIESPGQSYSLITTVALEPEPIPLDVKVVLLGDRHLYYLMVAYDPDFSELFKVAADFEDEMDRNQQNNLAYARLVANLAAEEGLLHFDRSAVARVVEHSSRLVSDTEKLSAHMQSVADLLREASYWARQAGQELVGVAHVERAIEARHYRAGRMRERVQESILRETILIATEGEQVGQVNGLSVMTVGDYVFGRPNRITARTRMGKGEVIDIERQVELGGPLHSKGVLILSSYLGARYAAERPFALAASLVFEQSYGGVEGDSASSAELYALLSALAEAPVKQSLAVTGSVNQFGQVQAIGGVNEKIEGFFDICQARGLTGEQGVLIPSANVKHLMLREDVIEAAAAGKFHVYPVDTVEQGIELLSGIPAGEADAEGNYPEGSIGQRIVARLEEIARTQREYDRSGSDQAEEEE